MRNVQQARRPIDVRPPVPFSDGARGEIDLLRHRPSGVK